MEQPNLVLDPAIAGRLKRDPAGLVAAIAQQHDTGEVLMLAWMNDEALRLTLSTGRATYFSRSRGTLWLKGETSGHYQYVKSVTLDCDGDALLVLVDQVGVACHTGERTCFSTDLPVSSIDVPASWPAVSETDPGVHTTNVDAGKVDAGNADAGIVHSGHVNTSNQGDSQ